MLPLYPRPLAKLYSASRISRVTTMVRLDVVADIAEEVALLAFGGDLGLDAELLVAVLGEDLAVAGEVGLLERGLGEGGLGVEEARAGR